MGSERTPISQAWDSLLRLARVRGSSQVTTDPVSSKGAAEG